VRGIGNAARADALAGAVFTVGGVAVVALVLAILVSIVATALPLFAPARIAAPDPVGSTIRPAAVGIAHPPGGAWWLRDSGRLEMRAADGVVLAADLGVVAPIRAAASGTHGSLAVVDETDTLRVGRVITTETGGVISWRLVSDPLSGDGIRRSWVALNQDDRAVTVAMWNERDPRVEVASWDRPSGSWTVVPLRTHTPVVDVAVTSDGHRAATVSGDGEVTVWTVHDAAVEAAAVTRAVAKVVFLQGDSTLVAARIDGSAELIRLEPRVRLENTGCAAIEVDGLTLRPDESIEMPDVGQGQRFALSDSVVITAAPSRWVATARVTVTDGRPTALAASPRGRTFGVGSADGVIALAHATTGRRLADRTVTDRPVRGLAFATDGDGLVVRTDAGLLRVDVSNPHPEISAHSLISRVRYEGYGEPRWIWQTTGGETFEPKYSLWPLLFGTFKATFYAMLVSVPLALSAAIYVSQLAPRWLQELVKPALELMAGVPTVVVGFVAALWLAPRLERYLLPSLIAALALPLIAVLGAIGWRALPRGLRRALPRGTDLALLALVSVMVFGGVAWIAEPIEALFFDGDLQRWLFTDLGVRYDQRNGLVVGLALGFAVIPVIFTLAEDACSSVPRPLTRAARALGATRWQTAVRLVLPIARPGLAAAVMLGLARAVGETMIVLMAAGNTPLLSASPLNGMRTMSAAIAFEIPEAVVASTHYRVLFLTGAVLLLFTLVVQTVSRWFVRELWRRSGAI
jgi:ABC-type uncharacterized transport system permease subunit